MSNELSHHTTSHAITEMHEVQQTFPSNWYVSSYVSQEHVLKISDVCVHHQYPSHHSHQLRYCSKDEKVGSSKSRIMRSGIVIIILDHTWLHEKSEFCENDDIRSYDKAMQIIDAEMNNREKQLDNNEKENQAQIPTSIIRSWEKIIRN